MDNKLHNISMKFELDEEDYEAIKNLEVICYEEQMTNLKLELHFKMRRRKNNVKSKNMTEFLYYQNEILAGYLGICNFHGTSVEVSGMVDPKFRRKGIFRKLYLIAKEEWQRIGPSEVLVLCDHTSLSGLAFIENLGGEYGCSEYKMCVKKKALAVTPSSVIKLRLATSEDSAEIQRQSSIYFGDLEEEAEEKLPVEVDDNFASYMAEAEEKIIGKIHICVTNNEGFIYGVGVIPEFRGKGYGRGILCSALNILKKENVNNIYLEVETENKNALGLYESCGFEEISVMDYYVVS